MTHSNGWILAARFDRMRIAAAEAAGCRERGSMATDALVQRRTRNSLPAFLRAAALGN
jgi:hypothetical protein